MERPVSAMERMPSRSLTYGEDVNVNEYLSHVPMNI